jgi:hypothetical protein
MMTPITDRTTNSYTTKNNTPLKAKMKSTEKLKNPFAEARKTVISQKTALQDSLRMNALTSIRRASGVSKANV